MTKRTTVKDLPDELIAHIVSKLDDVDIFASRLTCRRIEQAGFSHFGTRFFRKRGYLLWTPSLNVLSSISKHAELRKYVQHVWFNPDLYTHIINALECIPDVTYDGDQHGLEYDEAGFYSRTEDDGESTVVACDRKRRTQYAAYRACVDDHHLLTAVERGRLEAILTQAFSNLPNLATIGMRRSEDHAPWGCRSLLESTGLDPRILGANHDWTNPCLSGPARLFLALVNSMAASSVEISRLYTDVIEIDNICPSLLQQAAVQKACASVHYLEINAMRSNGNPLRMVTGLQGEFTDLNNGEFGHGAGDGLVLVLKATKQLKELGLQIYPERKKYPRRPMTLGSWRRSYPYQCMEKITKNVQLSHLTRLKLERVVTSPTTLIAFLAPMRNTLTSLKIRDVRLLSTATSPKPWQPVFIFLRDSIHELAYLLLYHLEYEEGGVSFVKDPSAPIPPEQVDPSTVAVLETSNGAGHFAEFEHIALEVHGSELVRSKLETLVEQHWYHNPLFTYAMDEGTWHTDTSDEDW